MTNIDKMNKRVIFNGDSMWMPKMNSRMKAQRHIRVTVNTTHINFSIIVRSFVRFFIWDTPPLFYVKFSIF